ncbi:MAG: YqeG family HAD IIIA-type phosphatase [Limnochordaceae bacterium]|nr:YqeG family HAD IIIA-type phosphatase [Limnochordaceae bacterium]
MAARLDQIDLGRFWKQGYRGILLDIDNTLSPWLARNPDPAAVKWVRQAQASGFRVCLVSNARWRRIRHYAQVLGVEMVHAGRKPGKRPFLAAAERLGLPVHQLIVVGDQLLTDVWGAKRVGMAAVLVDPISPGEFVGTRFARLAERFILWQLARRGRISRSELNRRLQALRRRSLRPV